MPISKYAECLSCRAELYVCRMCRFYDTGVAQDCSEPMAEEVKEKTRANYCEFFQPRADAYEPAGDAGKGGELDTLNALFGGIADPSTSEGAVDENRGALDALFGGGSEHKD
jgi:hypothetical protein